MLNKERKYKDVKTSELLDFIAKDFKWEDEKNRGKQQDYKDELEEREPFGPMKRKIDRMQEQINEQKNIIDLLMNHVHDDLGRVTVPIDKTKESW